MNPDLLERKFREVGVPLRLDNDRSWFGINVGRHRDREWIALSPGDSSVEVMDSDGDHRQLLLLVRETDGWGRPSKSKILCGRDESSLFSVRVTGSRVINTVAAAHEALKPVELRSAPGARRGPRYRNPRVIRQGDWFFVPRPDLGRQEWPGSQRNARLSTGGNPHIVDYLHGETRNLFRPPSFFWDRGFVFARGFVRHKDHRTISLPYWHRVLPNSAGVAPGGYLD